MTEITHEIAEHAMSEFGSQYRLTKDSDTSLKKAQERLFMAFNALLRETTLPRRSDVVPDGQEIEAYCQLYHPGWTIESQDERNVVLVQDPAVMAYTSKPIDGWVYGRDAVNGTPSLDDERLKVEDPDLWERLTMWPEPLFSLMRGIMAKYTSERYNDIDGMVVEYLQAHDVPRMLAPQDQWSHEDVALLEEYIVPGKVTARLRPPRQAREEELETNGEKT